MDIRLGAGQVALMTTTKLITTFAQLTLCLSIARSLSSIFSFLTRFFYGGEKREPVFFTSSVDSLASLLAASTFLVSRRYIFDFLRIVRRAFAGGRALYMEERIGKWNRDVIWADQWMPKG